MGNPLFLQLLLNRVGLGGTRATDNVGRCVVTLATPRTRSRIRWSFSSNETSNARIGIKRCWHKCLLLGKKMGSQPAAAWQPKNGDPKNRKSPWKNDSHGLCSLDNCCRRSYDWSAGVATMWRSIQCFIRSVFCFLFLILGSTRARKCSVFCSVFRVARVRLDLDLFRGLFVLLLLVLQ